MSVGGQRADARKRKEENSAQAETAGFTWEAAAFDVMARFWESPRPLLFSGNDWITEVDESLPDLGDEPALGAVLFGHIACVTLANNEWIPFDHMHSLLCSKQRDYGHGNILRWGQDGLVIRLADKIERYKNLHGSFATYEAQNESVNDTVLDIIGYCTIGVMLANGTFGRHLA